MHRRAGNGGSLAAGSGHTRNPGWNVDSGLKVKGLEIKAIKALEIEHDPCWGVVARVFLSTRPSVNSAVHQPVRQIRREQKVIESHAFVLLPPFKFVIPECPE